MKLLSLDLETRSAVDLKKTGVDPYARDASTDVWCAAWAIGDDEPEVWIPGDPVPKPVVAHVLAGGLVSAWNANFEIALWTHVLTRHGWPECPSIEQWRCSMVAALAMSLPGSLENAAGAVGLDLGKDMSGRRLMLTMAKPRRPRKDDPKPPPGEHLWWDDDERKQRLYAYCKQDVIVERDIRKRLVALTASEQRLWELDQRINKRGVRVDVELCARAKAVVAHVTQDLNREMAEVTDYAVSATTNVSQLKVWLKDRGIETESLDKEHLAGLLARKDLDADVRRAVELRQEASKASVAKINALLNGVGADGRARDLLQFHAANTGRWAGRRFQPQNIRRPSEDARPDEMIDILLSAPPARAASVLEVVYGPPLTCISDCLRGMIACDEGNTLYAADFSNIEGRVLAWLAGQTDKLAAFRAFDAGTGPDLYLVAAAGIYGCDVSALNKKSPERQIGKVSELACGYQGGVGAFQTMAHTYGVKVPDDQAQGIVDAWRANNPDIKNFWHELERAAKWAIRNPGKPSACRGVVFKVVGSFLWCRLPSGRALCYCYPRLQMREMPWGGEKEQIAYKGVDSYTRKWETIFTYGGKLAENITQAAARDVMAEAMVRMEAAGYPVVMTVHDEIVCETAVDFGSLPAYEKLMSKLPEWATGLPVAVEGWRGERYRK